MMTKAERLDLSKVVRLRIKVAKDGADQRAARLLADAESKLAAQYPADHPAWKEVTEEARKFVAEADAKIAQRCRELGIPEKFRPGVGVSWYGRGENAMKDRRAELRKVVERELSARAKAAKVEIERWGAQKLTELVSGALESEDARAFLESMPSIDDLMPPTALPELGVVSDGPWLSWLEEKEP